MFGMAERDQGATYRGPGGLEAFIKNGRRARLGEQAGPPLSRTEDETRVFEEGYRIPRFEPPVLAPGQTVRAVIGLDGGSTSSKAVLVSEDGELLAKAYQLSKGNPIQDTKELLQKIDPALRQAPLSEARRRLTPEGQGVGPPPQARLAFSPRTTASRAAPTAATAAAATTESAPTAPLRVRRPSLATATTWRRRKLRAQGRRIARHVRVIDRP